MNKFVPVENHTVHTMSVRFITCLIVVFSLSPTFVMSETYSASLQSTDTILVQKQQSSKKHKVKLYPNANHEVLFFSARGVDGRIYQLFLFDIEGRLVKQANIKNKQTTILNNIDKGNYLFEVFSDDERIENGQVIVR